VVLGLVESTFHWLQQMVLWLSGAGWLNLLSIGYVEYSERTPPDLAMVY
jgi:hypothetical protein